MHGSAENFSSQPLRRLTEPYILKYYIYSTFFCIDSLSLFSPCPKPEINRNSNKKETQNLSIFHPCNASTTYSPKKTKHMHILQKRTIIKRKGKIPQNNPPCNTTTRPLRYNPGHSGAPARPPLLGENERKWRSLIGFVPEGKVNFSAGKEDQNLA